MSNKKRNKRLGRKCPSCDGVLEIFTYTQNKQGVLYNEKIIECSECDYREKLKEKNNNKNKEEEFEDNNINNGG